MNIIKLKDIIMPDTDPNSVFFNRFLKGKYAYWVQTRYIVPIGLNMLDGNPAGMKHEGYIACEEDITKLLQKENGSYPKPYGSMCLDIYNYMEYVDQFETDKINGVGQYILKNSFSADEDITTDELKKFRTWLATTLLSMDQDDNGAQRTIIFDNVQTHVLSYYKNGLYDSTVQILTDFGVGETKIIDGVHKTSCGCTHASSNLSNLYESSVTICDPVAIYKKNIYEKMVAMFSELDFWTQWSPEFIAEFKKYVDNIVKMNLPFTQSLLAEKFMDCDCIAVSNQEESISTLKRLSVALEYIKNNDILGHKNYITSALTDWSSMLYEIMEW